MPWELHVFMGLACVFIWAVTIERLLQQDWFTVFLGALLSALLAILWRSMAVTL